MEASKVILYSTHCPQCMGVEMKLKRAGIGYTEVNDLSAMVSLGIQSVPVLSVDGIMYHGVDIYHKIDSMSVND